MTITLTRLTMAGLALAGSVFATGAASAGTWHLNAAACPDLREDRYDSRRMTGYFDRREDWRDRSVIDCPPQAWNYEPDRYERDRRYLSIAAQPRSPGTVFVAGNGGYFVRDYRGTTRWIDVQIHYPRDFRGRRFLPGRHSFPMPGPRHPHDRNRW